MSTLAMLLKESWAHVEDRADDLANNFYARLFLADPGLRELFPVQMSVQRSRLIAAMVAISQIIDDPERFDARLRELGRAHRRFHVEPAHYAIVGTALLGALREFAGERWCIEYDQAWRDAYDSMATKMLRAADYESGGPPYWHAEVVAHERRGRDVAVITCRPLRPFDYLPGQYVQLETAHQPRVWCPYSIANAPRPDGTLDLHVRAPSDGWVSAALVRRLRPGDVVKLGPAVGSMIADRNSTRDVVCVAGGTGLAPIKAILEELTKYNRSRWVHLFLGARDRSDLYDLPELTQLAARYPWLALVPACSNDPGFVGERGFISDVVEKFGPWREHDFFVCGPPKMVRATLGSLARVGVPQMRIRYDAMPGDGASA